MIIEIISIVVVLGIVLYFLRKENRKERKYFGKNVKLTSKEQKILEKYRQEYEPINPDERLANLERNHWELEDVAKTATEIIYDSPIPKKLEREHLRTGDLVKLKFLASEDGEYEIERIWVKVMGKKDGLFLGELKNDPFNEMLKPLNAIWFHPNHVFVIDKKQ